MKNITKSTFSCSRDGLVIRGVQYKSEGESLPIAIVCHGFMANKETVRHYTKALAKAGYAAFCFDFCGGCVVGGKSDGDTTKMSALTEVKDLEAVLSYVRSLPFTDAENVLLMGCSQGGFVSALTAAKKENNIRKLVLFYPAFCIPDDARKGQMMLAKFDPAHVPDTFFCGPMKLGKCYVQDVLPLEPFAQIAPFDGDVLLVHGTRDAIVNISYAEKAYETYRNRATGTIRYEIIKNGTHTFVAKHDTMAIDYLLQFANTITGG